MRVAVEMSLTLAIVSRTSIFLSKEKSRPTKGGDAVDVSPDSVIDVGVVTGMDVGVYVLIAAAAWLDAVVGMGIVVGLGVWVAVGVDVFIASAARLNAGAWLAIVVGLGAWVSAGSDAATLIPGDAMPLNAVGAVSTTAVVGRFMSIAFPSGGACSSDMHPARRAAYSAVRISASKSLQRVILNAPFGVSESYLGNSCEVCPKYVSIIFWTSNELGSAYE